jgi:hypothetical protein
MDSATRAELLTNARAKSVQEHIDELPMWADGTGLRSTPHDGDAVADLVARRRGQVF